ncbi:MAG: hypothetical protein KBF73_01820 [Flavobacteriales bacterium]|nr:hypothetical protein [Flavobacteriales bacterium]
MVELTEQQIELISAYIKQNGVAQDELHDDLLDHVCTSMENRISQGESFEEAFHYTLNLFGPGGLKQVQNETFELLTEMNAIMKKLTFGFGLTSTFLLLAGTIFKLMHWPGANVMVLLGTGLLVLGYLPLILAHKLKESPRSEALLHITGFVGLTMTSVGVLFKILHWPGAAVMLLGGMAILAFGYVPIYFFKRYKTSVNKPVTLSSSMVSVACLILIFALMKTGNSIYYENGVMLNNENVSVEKEQVEAINSKLYGLKMDDDISKLKSESDQLVKHLDDLKLELTAWATEAAPLEAKVADIYRTDKKHDLAIPRNLILGTDDAPNTGRFSASELIGMFGEYRSMVLTHYPNELQAIMSDDIGLRTDGEFKNAQGDAEDWSQHQFGNVPLFTVITNITQWQLEIRQMENQVLLSKISRPDASNPPS